MTTKRESQGKKEGEGDREITQAKWPPHGREDSQGMGGPGRHRKLKVRHCRKDEITKRGGMESG